ncbi:MAG: pirin family protein [Spirochaetes bacterium]|nr:pirin family protein [Spirochaetota bacterium]
MCARRIRTVSKSTPTMEGAGVHLRRAFGFHNTEETDPFLLLDDFRNDRPEHFIQGFPWHPHRGLETITYMLEGSVEHADSIGNAGAIHPGGVQWMTAGRGIVHQEMPKPDKAGRMGGFQLWANLPADSKMMPPRYQEFADAEIPVAELENGVTAKVVCGEIGGVSGPVENVVIAPGYYDVSMPAGTTFAHAVPRGHSALAYVIAGAARFDPEDDSLYGNYSLVLWEDGDGISVRTAESPARFLLVTGHPLGEPVAWHGPIVMNTDEELRTAFAELQAGTFLKG